MTEDFDFISELLLRSTLIDLSTDITFHAKGPFSTHVSILEADAGAGFFVKDVLPVLAPYAAGKISPESFPDGRFLRHEYVSASVHAGSHIDAPGHYGAEELAVNGLINSAPLSQFFQRGYMFDATEGSAGRVTPQEWDKWRERENIENLGDSIVLIRSGPNRSLSLELIETILDCGVNIIGSDLESFDGDFKNMIDEYIDSNDSSALWPCHVLGRRRPYYQIEKLSNLEKLPSKGFMVLALPILISGATAAWTRAIAIILPGVTKAL